MINHPFISRSVFNNDVGLFTKPFSLSLSLSTKFHSLSLPFCDPKLIAETICETLNNIEGVRYQFDQTKFIWEIEFGTTPKEVSVNNFQLSEHILKTKHDARLAAAKALEKYPYLVETLFKPDDNIVAFAGFLYTVKLTWTKFKIQVFYNEKNHSIYIQPNISTGYANVYTFNNLVDRVFNKLTKLTNWRKRANYLMFAEGIAYTSNDHTLKYLCDDLALKEIGEMLL